MIYEACVLAKFDRPVKTEGNLLETKNFQANVNKCKHQCNNNPSCESFKYCPNSGTCYLYDKKLSGSEETDEADRHEHCFTAFIQCQDGT